MGIQLESVELWALLEESSKEISVAMNRYNILLLLNTLALGAHLAIASHTLYVLGRRRKMRLRIPRALFVGFLILLGIINFAYFVYGTRAAERKIIDELIIWGIGGCSEELTPADAQDERRVVSCMSFGVRGVSGTESLGEDIPALLISILAQSYLVYRCFIIWGRRRLVPLAYSPILLLLAVFGVLNLLIEGDVRGSGSDILMTSELFYDNLGLRTALPWMSWGLSLFLNATITALIVGRLLWLRSKIRLALGKEHGSTYTGIAAILSESSLLYTLVVTVGYFALPGPGGTDNIFSPVLVQTECIASELIILRLAQGLAFTDETTTAITTDEANEITV